MRALGSEARHRAAGSKSVFAEASAWMTIVSMTGWDCFIQKTPCYS